MTAAKKGSALVAQARVAAGQLAALDQKLKAKDKEIAGLKERLKKAKAAPAKPKPKPKAKT